MVSVFDMKLFVFDEQLQISELVRRKFLPKATKINPFLKC